MSFKFRARYQKLGFSVWLGHLEVTDMLRRAVRCAGLPLAYTSGFHPLPKIGMGPALGVGIESEAEFFDVDLERETTRFADLIADINPYLSDGIKLLEIFTLPDGIPSIQEGIAFTNFLATFGNCDGTRLCKAVSDYAEKESFIVRSKKPDGRVKEVDAKGAIANLAVVDDNVLTIRLANRTPSVKIADFVNQLVGGGDLDFQLKKIDVSWRNDAK